MVVDAPGRRAAPLLLRLGAGVLLVCACLLASQPTFWAGMVNWDDDVAIAQNHAFRGLGQQQLAWMFTTVRMGPYQPLSWLSLALDERLWGLSHGLDAPQLGAWHATSVVLHVGAALALLAGARRLFARLRPDAGPIAVLAAAWVAAAAFALSPLRVESVAWLTERRDVLSGLFFALTLWAWFGWVPRGAGVRARSRAAPAAALSAALALLLALASLDLSRPESLSLRAMGAAGLAGAAALWIASALLAARIASGAGSARRFVACCLLFGASLLAKGTGMLLPLALLVADLWPLKRLEPRSLRGAYPLVLEKAPLLVLSVLAARLALWGQASQPTAVLVPWSEHTLVERLVQSVYALVWYVWKTILPGGLSALHALPSEVSLSSPRFALAALVFALGIVALLACLRRAPLLPATLVAYALLLAPVVGLSQAGRQLVAERYSYLPGMVLALGLGGAVLVVLMQRSLARTGVLLLIGLWIVGLGTACRRQVRVWHDSRSLWSHALEVDPHNAFAAQKLAQAMLAANPRAADVAAAIELLQRLPREDEPVWLSTSAQACLARARLEPAQRSALVEQALSLSLRAVALQGEAVEPELRLNLATALIEAGRPDQALAELRRYVEARPHDPLGWTNLGVALAASGNPGEACTNLRRALELDPSYAKGWQFLGRACEQLGDRAGALEAWRRVLALWPRSELALERVRALGG